MIQMETRTYRLTGFTPILGSRPASYELYTQFLMQKEMKERAKKFKSMSKNEVDAQTQRTIEEEAQYMRDMEQDKMTVFMANDECGGGLMLLDYQLQGFIKGSLEALTAQTGIKAPRGKVDKFVFVSPRKITICREDGSPIKQDDPEAAEPCERPLRAMTMQGERVCLASSEQIMDPWQITFSVSLLPNNGSKVSSNITFDDIELALDYGELRGIGQFRNGGYGRFTWERVDDQEKEKVKRHGA